MKNTFTVGQASLLRLLSSMQPICTKRTAMDVTSQILFQVGHREVSLKATDLEISLQASCAVEKSDIAEGSSFLVSGRRIFDLVRELEGEISFSLTENQLKLQSGTVDLALNVRSPEDFPPFPECIENLMQLDGELVLDMISRVAFVIPQNNANPALNGLFLEIAANQLCMTTTDGHCLAQARSDKYGLEEPHKWLLPRRAVFEMKKLLEGAEDKAVFLGTCGSQLVLSGCSFNFFSKVLADAFPQYDEILKREGFVPAKLDRPLFAKTLRRSSCLLSGQFVATQFEFGPEAVKVSMQNKNVGELREELPIQEFTGEPVDVRFYAPYLLSGLQVFSDEQVQFYLKNSSKPIIFESEADNLNTLYLVMPVAPTTNA